MKYIILFIGFLASSSANAERLTGINLQMNPFWGTGNLSNHAEVKSHIGIKMALDKVFEVRGSFYLGPRVEIGNSYLTTSSNRQQNKVLSTYDNRFVMGGLRAGFWFGEETHPSDLYVAGGVGRGYSKLQMDESGDNYYAQRKVNKIEGQYKGIELGGNWHVRRGFSFNGSLFTHVYDANQNEAKHSVDSEVATTKGIQLTSGDELDDIDTKVKQTTFGLALGFTIGF